MSRYPIEIRRLQSSGISIIWSDGSKQDIGAQLLRANCPCATCREARGEGNHETPLAIGKKSTLKIVESSSTEQTQLTEIWAVGNYALGILWGDNHSSGIYTYQYLEALSEKAGLKG